jgi:hypothetical protein
MRTLGLSRISAAFRLLKSRPIRAEERAWDDSLADEGVVEIASGSPRSLLIGLNRHGTHGSREIRRLRSLFNRRLNLARPDEYAGRRAAR